MARPKSASGARHSVESELKQIMVKTLEAEQRSKLLKTLLKMGLLTKEVKGFLTKQRRSQKRVGKKNNLKSGISHMKDKLNDSMRQSDQFRRERTKLRCKLEEVVNNKYKCKRIMTKLKDKVSRIKTQIQMKNQDKIKGYKEDKDRDDMDEIASLKEELGEFSELRIFNGVSIQAEEPKPPVITAKDVTLSKDEVSLLSKGPKFAIRNILNKEIFMAEFEKGLVKKKYGDIGKEEVDGKTVEEECVDEEEERCM